MPPARVRGLRPQETRSLLLQPLLSLLARQKARVLVGCGAGAGSRLPGKKRPDPSRCQSLAGQRGQAPVFSWAGAGRPAKTRGRAAAGHIPSPSPPHCRESYSASGNQEIMECCLLYTMLSLILLPEWRHSAASPWKYDPYLSCLAAVWRILVQARAQHCKLFRLTEIGMHTSKEMAECAPSK